MKRRVFGTPHPTTTKSWTSRRQGSCRWVGGHQPKRLGIRVLAAEVRGTQRKVISVFPDVFSSGNEGQSAQVTLRGFKMSQPGKGQAEVGFWGAGPKCQSPQREQIKSAPTVAYLGPPVPQHLLGIQGLIEMLWISSSWVFPGQVQLARPLLFASAPESLPISWGQSGLKGPVPLVAPLSVGEVDSWPGSSPQQLPSACLTGVGQHVSRSGCGKTPYASSGGVTMVERFCLGQLLSCLLDQTEEKTKHMC